MSKKVLWKKVVNALRTNRLFMAAALSTLVLNFSLLEANEGSEQKRETPSNPNRFYIGLFGGVGSSNTFDVTQKGTAFYPDSSGGPLAVNAKGHSYNNSVDIVGLHFGYEWLCSKHTGWYFTPGVEIEGYYGSTKTKAKLTNPTDRLSLHQFKDTFPINMGVMLLNWTLILNNNRVFKICPYIGVGAGASILSIHSARSTQTAPPEPGINHFNSDRNASDWVFAAQGKAGLRFAFAKWFRLFAEYRFLYLSSSDYTFGSTKYPTHVATSKWKINFEGICNNMFVFGFDIPL